MNSWQYVLFETLLLRVICIPLYFYVNENNKIPLFLVLYGCIVF